MDRQTVTLTHPLCHLCLLLQEGISSVPTFKSFLNGKVTAQFSGANVETLKASAKALAELK